MTPAEAEAELNRQYQQLHCKHAFIKHVCDREATCAHCGKSKSEYEAETPQLQWGYPP